MNHLQEPVLCQPLAVRLVENLGLRTVKGKEPPEELSHRQAHPGMPSYRKRLSEL
jgi:hypothetical protein